MRQQAGSIGVAHHGLADGGDAHHRQCRTRSPASTSLVMLWIERVSCSPADEHLMPTPAAIQAHRVLHVHRDLLVGELVAQDARAPLARSTIGFCESAGTIERRMPRVQNSASQAATAAGSRDRCARAEVVPWK